MGGAHCLLYACGLLIEIDSADMLNGKLAPRWRSHDCFQFVAPN